ncbi:hypothetical protein MMC11_006036 [Xylographa trunciseda]|nr:hypothetical protein [Xylographa trunciseda]
MAPTSSHAEIDSLIDRLESLTKDVPADEATRKRLYDVTQKLNLAVEPAQMTVQRIMYTPLQLTVARIACDLHVFELLAKQDGSSMDIDSLASSTKADKVLLHLGRILVYLAATGMVAEPVEDKFAANNITKALAIPGYEAGIYHNFDTALATWQYLPEFLRNTNYKNPSDSLHCAFQLAHNTDLHTFKWALTQPEKFANFNKWMTAARAGEKNWLDDFPFEAEVAQNVRLEEVLFVDVGGGIGTQCRNLKTKLPRLPGRVVLQDLAPAIKQALPVDGMEAEVHDFYTEQPVKGARAYYLRKIMHDYPDDKCVVILQRLVEAMNEKSVILIDDMILPTQGTHWRGAQIDLAMMASLAGMERSEKQWASLLDQAGLRVKKTCTYNSDLGDSIMVAVPR